MGTEKRYEAPVVVRLGELAKVSGGGTDCTNGSGVAGNCKSGTTPNAGTGECESGNTAKMKCMTGTVVT